MPTLECQRDKQVSTSSHACGHIGIVWHGYLTVVEGRAQESLDTGNLPNDTCVRPSRIILCPTAPQFGNAGGDKRGFALQTSLHFRHKQCCLRKKRCPGKCPPQAAFGPPKGKRRSRCGKHARGGTPRTRRIRDAPSRTARIRWSPCDRGIKSQPPHQR